MDSPIRIRSRLGKRQRTNRADAEVSPARDGDVAEALPLPDTLARRLALAHYVERLIENGKLRNYAHASAVLGITRARMSQLMDLALLPADVQERVLFGTDRWSERDFRPGAQEQEEPPAT